jgi:4-amino-4-deoxy-L-arabinose transferase-like glycosyltransferase
LNLCGTVAAIARRNDPARRLLLGYGASIGPHRIARLRHPLKIAKTIVDFVTAPGHPGSPARLRMVALGFFVLALFVNGWHIQASGIAAAYADPLNLTRAQDESVWVNSALTVAHQGDWLTPRMMSRLFLFKPPLLVWLVAASFKMLGWTLLAARMPVLVFGACGVAAAFFWTARARSGAAGALAAVLLLLDPLWRTFSRLCYTDVLSATLNTLAGVTLALDPRMSRLRSAVLFGTFAGASVMTKSVAGVLPFVSLALYCALVSRDSRPPLKRFAQALLAALVVAAPWHLYQLWAHPLWFQADYIQVQLLGVGIHAVSPGGAEMPLLFHVRRLVFSDPLLWLGVLIALLNLRRVPDAAKTAGLVALCWAASALLALSVFQARNLPYSALLVPPLCVMVGIYLPRKWDQARFVIPFVAAVFVLKLALPMAPWSLRREAPPLDGARAMRAYYGLRRDTDLIAVDADDEFYSATIPLKHVRYCFVDPAGHIAAFAPHYAYLGITMSSREFRTLDQVFGRYAQRLHHWGLDDTTAIATTIVLDEPAALNQVIESHPASDYYVPAGWVPNLTGVVGNTHDAVPFSSDRIFLLSRSVRNSTIERPPLPERW